MRKHSQHNNDERTQFFRKIYLSKFIRNGCERIMCERWVGDWTDSNILTPNSSVFSSTSFSFCWAAQSGILRAHSPLLGAGSLYSILSPTNWTSCRTGLYHCLISTCFMWESHLHRIQPVHSQGYPPDIFDRMHLFPDRRLGRRSISYRLSSTFQCPWGASNAQNMDTTGKPVKDDRHVRNAVKRTGTTWRKIVWRKFNVQTIDKIIRFMQDLKMFTKRKITMNMKVNNERPGSASKLPTTKFYTVPSTSKTNSLIRINKQCNAQGSTKHLQRTYRLESMDSDTNHQFTSLNLEEIINNYNIWNHLTVDK